MTVELPVVSGLMIDWPLSQGSLNVARAPVMVVVKLLSRMMMPGKGKRQFTVSKENVKAYLQGGVSTGYTMSLTSRRIGSENQEGPITGEL